MYYLIGLQGKLLTRMQLKIRKMVARRSLSDLFVLSKPGVLTKMMLKSGNVILVIQISLVRDSRP